MRGEHNIFFIDCSIQHGPQCGLTSKSNTDKEMRPLSNTTNESWAQIQTSWYWLTRNGKDNTWIRSNEKHPK
jgi:hypothetical protein